MGGDRNNEAGIENRQRGSAPVCRENGASPPRSGCLPRLRLRRRVPADRLWGASGLARRQRRRAVFREWSPRQTL